MRRFVALAALLVAALAPGDADARRRGPIDVDLRAADVVESLRFLADAADVGLVVGDGVVSGTVTIRMRHVDPLTALVTVAELKGAEAVFTDGIVTVRRAGPHADH